MRSWASMLRTARAPVWVLVLGVIGLLAPPQTQDMMAAMEDGWLGTLPLHIALMLLAFSAWYWARATLAARFKVHDTLEARRSLLSGTGTGERPPVDPRAFEWVPRLLFIAAALLGVALLLNRFSPFNLILILAWSVAAIVILKKYRQKWRLTNTRKPKKPPEAAHGWRPWIEARLAYPLVRLLDYAPVGVLPGWVLLIAGVLVFFLGAIESFMPQQLMPERWPGLAVLAAAWFPGPAIAVLGLALMIAPLSAVTFIADGFRLQLTFCGALIGPRRPPVILFLALWVFVFVPYFFEAHTVRLFLASANYLVAIPFDQRVPLGQMLLAWSGCRNGPGNGPIRPVVVAISGGATRAGLWGARVLQAVDEAAGDQHHVVFAVSSVSGGSLGAAAYLALHGTALDERGCAASPARPVDKHAFLALRKDALGPLLAGRLLGDLPRALITPFAWIARLMQSSDSHHPQGGDSAEAIERAFEKLWQPTAERLGALGFDQSFLSLFYRNGSLRRGMPIWIANGTDAATGNRVLTAPFQPYDATDPNDCANWPIRGARDALGLLEGDVAISTAINNTARFPFLEPFGTLLRKKEGTRAGALVDGGYFENEGLQTALDLADWLKHCGSALLTRPVDPIIVVATGDGNNKNEPVRCLSAADHPLTPSNKNVLQILAPVLGIYDVRSGHSTASLHQAREQYCPAGDPHFFHFYLPRVEGKTVPLNWVLSERVANGVWDALGTDPGNMAEFGLLRKALAR